MGNQRDSGTVLAGGLAGTPAVSLASHLEPAAWRPLRILQVNSGDLGGGGRRVAWTLFQAYRDLGHESWLAVNQKRSADPDVLVIPSQAPGLGWSNVWGGLRAQLQASGFQIKGMGRLKQALSWISDPGIMRDELAGKEVFRYPGSRRLLELAPAPPDIVHCHTLHGGYFDLNFLPRLSRQVPVVLTLHDFWLLTGHCALPMDCVRWQTGCGQCPDLSAYPAIRRDATAANWQRKRNIYAGSRLYLAAPSQWLMEKAQRSMLAPLLAGARVIPNGVDTSVFKPADLREARQTLGIPQDAKVLLFAASGIRQVVWKDYASLRRALALMGQQWASDQRLMLIALGEDAPHEQLGQAEIRFVAFQKDPEMVARYFQAADVYIHAGRVETFGLALAEALACGVPAVATSGGAIPELVQDGETGFLVPPGDAAGLARRASELLQNVELRQRMGAAGTALVRAKFDRVRQVAAYLNWYYELVEQTSRSSSPIGAPDIVANS